MKITQSILILFLIAVIIAFNRDMFNLKYIDQFINSINNNNVHQHQNYKECLINDQVDDVFDDENDDVFATENGLTEDADCAISDALKSVR